MHQFIRLFKFSKNLKRYYVSIFFLSVTIAILEQVMPFVLREVVNQLTSEKEFTLATLGLVSLIFIANTTSNFLGNVNGYFGDMLSIKLKGLLSNAYYEKLFLLPQKYFDDEHTGTVIGRLDRSIRSITDFMKQLSNLFFSVMVASLFSLSVVFYYAWPAAVLIVILFPIYLKFTNLASKVWQEEEAKVLENQDIANGRFAEVVSEIRVTKSFNQAKYERKLYRNRFKSMIKHTNNQSIRWHKYDVYRRLSQDFVFAASISYVIWQAYEGAISVGDVFLLFTLMQQAILPLRFISFMVDNYQKMITSSKDYFKVMDLAIDERTTNSKKLALKKGVIEFDSVKFGYEKNQTVLDDVSFKVKPMTKLALVGESGEGKSTITQLLLQLYSPEAGHIKIDGKDIKDINPDSLRSNIGVVFQEASLFSGSIKENIAYSKPDSSDKEIERAAKAANAHEFIEKLKDSYETEIGERGLKLSGGQKQRIAIARAILKDPPILILDEATSSLDRKSELIVQDALDKLMKGRTTIVIAHRLSTIANVDTIVTINNGLVDEIGTPQELAKSGGIYNQLLELQDSNSSRSKKLLKQFDIVS